MPAEARVQRAKEGPPPGSNLGPASPDYSPQPHPMPGRALDASPRTRVS
jgi:hypothetical protein